MKKNMHQTPSEQNTDEEIPPQTDQSELQRIEGVGPLNKGDFGAMPSPIRYFGYFFFTSSALMLLIGIILQLFK